MIMANSGKCAVCGRRVNAGYVFCIGCERKRGKVISDCVRAGLSYTAGCNVADKSYPRRLWDDVRERDEFYSKDGRSWVLRNGAWLPRH